MSDWLEWVAHENAANCVLVQVIATRGSAPRGAGARMVITADAMWGSIGGGQLEYRALDHARAVLARTAIAGVETYSLGPELDQCCGGQVELAFECWTGDATALLDRIRAGERLVRIVRADMVNGLAVEIRPEHEFDGDRDNHDAVFIDRLSDDRQPLWLYGAGHVGQAVIGALAPLPFRVTWVDQRGDQFPAELPGNAEKMVTDDPVSVVATARPAAFHLVMTHSHPLDQAICEAVLRRGDFGYLGLIGSDTKRKSFARRFFVKGFDRASLDRLHCPIGLSGIESKEPASIAASVAADLLMRREAARASGQLGESGDGRSASPSHAQSG